MRVVRVFAESSSTQWTPNQDYNRLFMGAQEKYLNDLLRSRTTPLFLNEVYDALGMSRTREGQTTGWAPGTEVCFRPNFSEKNVMLHLDVVDVLEFLE